MKRIATLSAVLFCGMAAVAAETPSPVAMARGAEALRETIDFHLEELTRALLADIETPDQWSAQRVQRDVNKIEPLIARYQIESPQGGAEVSERWVQLREKASNAVEDARLESRNDAQLARLRQKARGAIVALTLNQKVTKMPLPPSLTLLNEMDAQQESLRAAERKESNSFREFLSAWQAMSRTLVEKQAATDSSAAVKSVDAAPLQRHSTLPGILSAAVLFLVGAILLTYLALDERLRKRFWIPLQELARSAEAAASGDLSRRHTQARTGIVGRLDAALNRLITVLARSENRVYQLSSLVDSADEAIISQALDGTIVSWNKGAQRMYGYSVDEVRGQPITVLAAHQDTAPLTTMFEAAIRGEKVQPVEMLHEGTSGRTVRVLLRVAAIYDSTKNVIGVSWWAQNLAEWDTQELPIRSSISMDDSTPPA